MNRGRTFIWIQIGLIIIIAVALLLDSATAEEETVWVLCDPESYVCIRNFPKKSANAFGGTTCGRTLKSDGKEKNGFIHVVDLAAEEDNGWISAMYIVHEAPVIVRQPAIVVSNGRLAARNGVNGKVKKWLKPMEHLTVLCWTSEWCLTNYGYVRSEFLDFEGE